MNYVQSKDVLLKGLKVFEDNNQLPPSWRLGVVNSHSEKLYEIDIDI